MTLPVHVREAIKSGLAMVLTLGIALYMDFLNPYWAGFAVAFISLDTSGQSLNKALLRMMGTLVGLVATLALAMWTIQHRWGMMLALTPWIGLCTYKIAGNRRQYFWFVSGFVAVIVLIKGDGNSLEIFQTAVARVEETALGIGVYGLVSVFLWPRTSLSVLETSAQNLVDIQLQLFQAYRGLMGGRGRLEDSRPLRLRADAALQQVGATLAAAETDTYAVWEVRHAWRSLDQSSRKLLGAFGRWRTAIPEVQGLELTRILPGFELALEELEDRIVKVQQALDGEDDGTEPEVIDASVENETELSLFERSAVAQLLAQLRGMDEATRAVLQAVRDVRGSNRVVTPPAHTPRRWSIDPDALRSALSVIATMWAGFLIWVWADPPGHAGFWFGATLFSMMSVLARQPVRALLPGILLGIFVGGLVYVLVMPHLAGYFELALVIFVVTAGGFWVLSAPQQGGTRSGYLAMFLTSIALDNRNQTYDFAAYVNGSMAYLLGFALIALMSEIPSSQRPEKVFLRLLSRFFRQAEMLMGRLAPDPAPPGLVERARRAFYHNDLLEIPAKLVTLAERVDCRLLPGTRTEQLRDLVLNMATLTMRIEELLDARQNIEPDQRLEEVVSELREWRELAQRQFRLWADDPAAALFPDADMSARLHERLERIEAALEAARMRSGGEELSVDHVALYRYLGGFRGLSEAAIGYASVASHVPWGPWKEARF
jgi:uncharacterized membrane protein YccC